MRVKFLLALIFTLTTALIAQASPYNGPEEMLQAYYNAINEQDYRRAYEMRWNSSQTLDEFTVGFADTLRVEPYLGAFQRTGTQAGSPAGWVPAALVTYKTDRSIKLYYGCFSVIQPFASNDAWLVSGGSFQIAPPEIPPVSSNIQAALGINCNTLTVAWPGIGRAYDLSEAAYTMLRYYDHINNRQFNEAYAMWLQPIPGPKPNGAPAEDYRPPYDQFVAGYNDTSHVTIYPGLYNYGGASAGHPYLDGTLVAVLVTEKIDGRFETYAGCYVVGALNEGLGIVSGAFVKVADGLLTGQEIIAYQNGDCLGLVLKL